MHEKGLHYDVHRNNNVANRAVTITLIGGGGGWMYIHSTRQISFQINQFEFDLK